MSICRRPDPLLLGRHSPSADNKARWSDATRGGGCLISQWAQLSLHVAEKMETLAYDKLISEVDRGAQEQS
jgi:hypothetical protein